MTASALRVGIVGFGKIAKDQHVPAIAATPGARLTAVASRNASADGVANYTGLTEMLASEPELDAVAMCQPPQFRFAAARDALLAGKHVFLEKPPGATLSEVEALVRLSERQGVTLFASWHSREAAAVQAAKLWLADRDIGRIEINWKEDVRVWHPGQAWIWEPGGFGVFDPGINALSILTAIVPDEIRVKAAELDMPENCCAPIAAALSLETLAGVPIRAEFDFRQTGTQVWDIAVETDRGEMLLREGGNRLSIAGVPHEPSQEAEYARLYAEFVRLIRKGDRDVDVSPLRLVADAFLCGHMRTIEPFEA